MIVPMLPIEQNLVLKAVLINKSDIDLTTLTQSGATVMLLTSGKTGFDVSWIKQLQLVLNFQ
jgi:hypothetical protein